MTEANKQSRPFRHLCPEADMRDAMSDTEFWEHVAAGLSTNTEHEEPYYDGPELDVQVDTPPCPVCGSTSACSYDSEGRALIHAISEDTDEIS